MSPKLAMFTTQVINTKLVIAINHSIFKNFSKFLNGLESKLCKLYFVS
jgi:hypothetical protein